MTDSKINIMTRRKAEMKKRLIVILSISIFVILSIGICYKVLKSKDSARNKNEETVSESTDKIEESDGSAGQNKSRRKLIIDSDAGADDCAAIIYAAKQPNVDILGVTVLLGNVELDQAADNVLMALEKAGCDAPVYKGEEKTYNRTMKEAYSVFGEDGMGDADIIHPSGSPEDKAAVEFIIDTVRDNPGEVEIVCLGPATNIAKAIDVAPDVMKDVKMIWSMGTTGLGAGNASPVAEFNVYADAPAYKVLVDSGLPLTIVGLDMCTEEAAWTNEQFAKLESEGEEGSFVAKSLEKLREFYKGNGSDTVMVCDPITVMCVLHPNFVKEKIQTHASCITVQGETYGQVLFYKEGFTYDSVENDFDYNVTLVTKVDKAAYFDYYMDGVCD